MILHIVEIRVIHYVKNIITSLIYYPITFRYCLEMCAFGGICLLKNTYITKTHFELYDTFIPIFRLLFIMVLIGVTVYVKGIVHLKVEDYFCLSAYLLYALTLVFFKKSRKWLAYKYPLILAMFEMLLITYGVACFGGAKSSFYLLYIIVISFFAIVYNLKFALITGFLSTAYYISILLLTGEKMSSDVFIKVLFLFAYSYFNGAINQKLNNYNLELATTDKLTLLYNRQFFYGEFENVLALSAKKNMITSLVVMDVDNFKIINDVKGHLEGDRILAEIGTFIRQNIREGDIAARYGGDEFVIVFPNTDKENALIICERLNSSIQNHFMDNVTISIGFAVFPSNGNNSKDLFHVADLDMYQTKALKKNIIVN